MASTNKTTGFSLSQFIGTDKPSWLGDYNGDMLKIDTGMLDIKATAEQGNSTATSAASAAAAAQQTANSALTKANQNETEIEGIKDSINYSNLSVTLNENVEKGENTGVQVIYSKLLTVLKIGVTINFPATNKTVVGSTLRIPFASITGNIFSIPVSNISETSSQFFMGSAMFGWEIGSAYKASFTVVKCYYDGANTVFYLESGEGFFNSVSGVTKTNATCVSYNTTNVLKYYDESTHAMSV